MSALPVEAGPVLVGLAREAIEGHLDLAGGRHGLLPAEVAEYLARPGASFVTLTLGGRLRGCIGSLAATRALSADVAANAVHAGFDDPRFPPLRREEYPGLRVEVSVLSVPEPLPVAGEEQAIARLRPGIDGVVLIEGHHRATFLPQVWDQIPDPRQFLAALRRKAGLPPGRWGSDTRLEHYTVTAFEDPR